MERLVPELALRLRRQHAIAGARERRGEDQPAHALRCGPGDGLRDAAADVVAREHGAVDPEVVHEADDAARLCRRGVADGRLHRVFVGLPEPAQVRHDDVRLAGQQRRQRAVVGARPRPAVQQQHQRPVARAVVGQEEAVDRRRARQAASSIWRIVRFAG